MRPDSGRLLGLGLRLRPHPVPLAPQRGHQDGLHDGEDVLAARVVGPELRPLGGVERALEQRAKDRGLHGFPVKTRGLGEHLELPDLERQRLGVLE